MSVFNRDEKLTVAEQAAQWLCDLQEEDGGRQPEFFIWLRQSPRHVEEFLFATAMWKKLHRFGHEQPQRVQRLLADAEAAAHDAMNVVQLGAPSPATAPPRVSAKRRWLSLAAAASIAVAAVATILFVNRAPAYTTSIGEQRIVQLDDGSRVDLNTRSRIELHYSAEARDIRLLEGEALFTVAKDAQRPFRVIVNDTVIQALGTQFNVYRQAESTQVSVLEGAVQITSEAEPTKLTAGEAARVEPGKSVAKQKAPDVVDAVAWRERRLVFRADRLENVAKEANRYSRKPIRIEDAAAREVKLTAVFDADDPESLVRFLDHMAGVEVERRRDEVIVRSR